MSREFAVVGGWAAANAGLALGLLAFPQPMILPVLIFVGAAVLVALFGLVAMLAVHADQAACGSGSRTGRGPRHWRVSGWRSP